MTKRVLQEVVIQRMFRDPSESMDGAVLRET